MNIADFLLKKRNQLASCTLYFELLIPAKWHSTSSKKLIFLFPIWFLLQLFVSLLAACPIVLSCIIDNLHTMTELRRNDLLQLVCYFLQVPFYPLFMLWFFVSSVITGMRLLMQKKFYYKTTNYMLRLLQETSNARYEINDQLEANTSTLASQNDEMVKTVYIFPFIYIRKKRRASYDVPEMVHEKLEH